MAGLKRELIYQIREMEVIKMARFRDIKPFVDDSHYRVDVPWGYLEQSLKGFKEDFGLDLDPDFQRPHVWTKEQQIAYVEYKLQQGPSGNDVYLNSLGFSNCVDKDMVLVDGKQRIEAVKRFLNNEIKVFGSYYKEYEDKLSFMYHFTFHINTLKTRAEILKWYLLFNAGGTPHTEEELNRVRLLLQKEI